MKAKPEVREYLSDSERQNIVRVAERRNERIQKIGNCLDVALDLVGYECDWRSKAELEDTTSILIEQLAFENGECVKRILPTEIVEVHDNVEVEFPSQRDKDWVDLHIQLDNILEALVKQYKQLEWIQKRVKHRGKVIPFPIEKRTGKSNSCGEVR